MLAALPEMLRTARFDGERMEEATGGFALATELADFLAANGVPFREAHHAVGRLVKRCEELNVSLEKLPREELAAAHSALAELPKGLLSPRGSVQNKRSAGSTASDFVEEQLSEAREYLETNR
jgi:argininosuccinate lyase